jgi:hypothetical protein
MKAYRKLIAVLGIAVFFFAANGLMRERDTNNTGTILKLPFDIYEHRGNQVILVALLTICPLGIIVNHLGWIIARGTSSVGSLRRVATLDEYHPAPDAPESAVYAIIFAFIYHLFPFAVATHLFVRLFVSAPSNILWNFKAENFFSGNAARFEGISYYAGWMTPLFIALYVVMALSLLRLVFAIFKGRRIVR